MGKHTKTRSRQRHPRTSNTVIEVELLMECVDEELSPAQKSAHKKRQQEYNAFIKMIDQQKASGAKIEYLKTALSASQIADLEARPVVSIKEYFSDPVITYTPLPVQSTATPNLQVLHTSHQVSKKSTSKAQSTLEKGVIYKSSEVTKALQSNTTRPVRKAAKNANQFLDEITGAKVEDNDDDVIMLTEAEKKTISAGALSVKGRKKTANILQTGLETVDTITIPGVSTAGYGTKRRTSVGNSDQEQPAKKRVAVKKDDFSTHLVPLHEYYYSKKEGDPVYREEKGEFRFKCWYCHKMLYNNVRIMQHMQAHIDSERQQSLELSDLTQCKHCYKQFDTPFDMQCHIEKVHQNSSNVLLCRICEKDHDTQVLLRQHMKSNHNACEMPYICQLCNFRSSWYSDVVDHFKKRHDSSQFVMCIYCLKVFKLLISKTAGWGLTQHFYQHIQKHAAKANNKKCNACKLTFLNKVDAKTHRQRDHLPNFRGAISAIKPLGGELSSNDQVMIKVSSENSSKLKSLNAPTVVKMQEMKGVTFNWVTDTHRCRECNQPINSGDHYKKYMECTLCRYATTCNNAYSFHMMGFHSGNLELKLKMVPVEKSLATKWFCLCGFSTDKGNSLANHLVICSKRTGYINKPQQKFFEYDDEQEEFNPFEPYVDEPELKECDGEETPSLFGALGLVRRQGKPGSSSKVKKRKISYWVSSPEHTAEEIASDVMDSLLDNLFPEEAEAQCVVNKLLRNLGQHITAKEREEAARLKPLDANPPLENIPPELQGSEKWSTVKIKQKTAPSKASVFLGTSSKKDEPSNEDSEDAKTEVCGTVESSEVSNDTKCQGDDEPLDSVEAEMDTDEIRKPTDVKEGKNDEESPEVDKDSEIQKCQNIEKADGFAQPDTDNKSLQKISDEIENEAKHHFDAEDSLEAKEDAGKDDEVLDSGDVQEPLLEKNEVEHNSAQVTHDESVCGQRPEEEMETEETPQAVESQNTQEQKSAAVPQEEASEKKSEKEEEKNPEEEDKEKVEETAQEDQVNSEDKTTSEKQVTSEEKTTSENQVTSEEKTTSENQVTSEEKTTSENQVTSEEKTTSENQVTSEEKTTSENQVTSEEKNTSEDSHSKSEQGNEEAKEENSQSTVEEKEKIETLENVDTSDSKNKAEKPEDDSQQIKEDSTKPESEPSSSVQQPEGSSQSRQSLQSQAESSRDSSSRHREPGSSHRPSGNSESGRQRDTSSFRERDSQRSRDYDRDRSHDHRRDDQRHSDHRRDDYRRDDRNRNRYDNRERYDNRNYQGQGSSGGYNRYGGSGGGGGYNQNRYGNNQHQRQGSGGGYNRNNDYYNNRNNRGRGGGYGGYRGGYY